MATAFHTDYPVSPSFNTPMSVYKVARANVAATIVDVNEVYNASTSDYDYFDLEEFLN